MITKDEALKMIKETLLGHEGHSYTTMHVDLSNFENGFYWCKECDKQLMKIKEMDDLRRIAYKE